MKMCLAQVLTLFSVFLLAECVYYDRFSGEKVDEVRMKDLKAGNLTEVCTVDTRPCTPHEGSRIDGSCNNFKYPSLGTARGPYARLLSPHFAENGEMKKSESGKPLPSARLVRTSLQSTGRVTDKSVFNVAAIHFLDFINRDISVLYNSKDYLTKGQDCCSSSEQKDSRCMSIEVPEDDPYLKVTGIRCLNFSRAETFQDIHCLSESMLPEHINLQTPLVDLSTIYGVDEKSMNLIRKWENGLLLMDERNGHEFPISNGSNNLCLQNLKNETNCYSFGFPEVGNFDLRTTSFTIFFMREHNRLAKSLNKLNPCWKDDRLFKVARQINIGTALNIFMYELLPLFLGQLNMVNYGLLSSRKQRVHSYDEEALPLVFAEYEIAIRFFRTLLDGRIKKYNESYNYVGELSYSDYVLRQGVLEYNENFEEINRGTFYQNAAKIDDILDPEISEHYFGDLQKAYDQAAADIQRSRDFGIRGYNDYREICGLETAKTFEDFADVIDIEKLEVLKRLYEHVDDVDLLAGIISENHIQNTFVGPTLFCIIARQMNVYRLGDRFWFERGDQFHSFTSSQLREIRKTNLARLACDNAEGIKYIQPQAFRNVRTDNIPVSCSHIPGAELIMWRDENCYKKDQKFTGIFGREPSDEFLLTFNNLPSFKSNFAFL